MQASPDLHADLEALEGGDAADAADGGVGVDGHRQIGVGAENS
jgi:hypothetical protein